MDSKSQNCIGCTYHGCKYNKCFHSSAKWDKLHLLQDVKAAKIQKIEVQIEELSEVNGLGWVEILGPTQWVGLRFRPVPLGWAKISTRTNGLG